MAPRKEREKFIRQMTQWDEGIPSAEQSPRTAIDASSPAMAHKLAWTLGALSAFGAFSIDTYLPAFPRVALDLGTSIGLVEVTLAVFLLGMAIGQILWGILSDRSGRRGADRPACCLLLDGHRLRGHAFHRRLDCRALDHGHWRLRRPGGPLAIVRDLYEETEAARFYSMMMIVSGMAPIVAPFWEPAVDLFQLARHLLGYRRFRRPSDRRRSGRIPEIFPAGGPRAYRND